MWSPRQLPATSQGTAAETHWREAPRGENESDTATLQTNSILQCHAAVATEPETVRRDGAGHLASANDTESTLPQARSILQRGSLVVSPRRASSSATKRTTSQLVPGVLSL